MATIVRAGGVPATGNAGTSDVLAGKTFSNDDGTDLTGTMENLGFEPEACAVGLHDGYVFLYPCNHDANTYQAIKNGIKVKPEYIAQFVTKSIVVHNLGVFNSNSAHDVSVSGYPGYQNLARDNFWVRVTGVGHVGVSDTNSAKNQIVGDYNASTGVIHLNPCYNYENYHGRHYYVEYTLFLLTVE